MTPERALSAGYGFRAARAASCTPFSGEDINNVSAFKDIDSRKLRAAESVRSGAVVASSAATSAAAAASSSVASQRMSRQEARSSKVESTKVQQETQKMTAVKQQCRLAEDVQAGGALLQGGGARLLPGHP